jgi:hypothetical protein
MKIPSRFLFAVGLLLAAGGSPLAAQHLHTNDEWDECAIVLDPSLTQEAWHQFVSELGLVAYFRPLASARPLGARRIELAILSTATRIDDADAAWNDTFSHPDSSHYLTGGDALAIPGLMLRVGATDRLDVGAYFTKNIESNYGIAGAQLQYALLNDTTRGFAAAGRVSYARVFGPDDVTASVYGLDLVASKDISVFSPYVGVSGYLSRGHERTDKVELDDENVLGVQAMAGVAVSVSVLRLGAEVNLARVPGYAFKVAFGI